MDNPQLVPILKDLPSGGTPTIIIVNRKPLKKLRDRLITVLVRIMLNAATGGVRRQQAH